MFRFFWGRLAPVLSLSPFRPDPEICLSHRCVCGACKGRSPEAPIRSSCPPLPGPSALQLRRTGAAAEEAPHCPLLLYRGWTPIRASPVSGGTGDAVSLPPSRSRSRRPALRPKDALCRTLRSTAILTLPWRRNAPESIVVAFLRRLCGLAPGQRRDAGAGTRQPGAQRQNLHNSSYTNTYTQFSIHNIRYTIVFT